MRKRKLTERFLAEPINYGGIITPRAAVIRHMRDECGYSQAMIDRWFQGYELMQRKRNNASTSQ